MKNLLSVTFAFIFIICLLDSAETIFACDCPTTSIKDSLEKSNLIFLGKVVGIEYRKNVSDPTIDDFMKNSSPLYTTLVLNFEVKKWWKGEAPKEVSVIQGTVYFGSITRRSSCDFDFDFGGTYLVFAGGKENEHRTSNCTRTARAAQAEDDLKFLGEGKAPVAEMKPVKVTNPQ